MTRQGSKTLWTLACACVLALAGLADSAAQFPPPPQSGSSNPFPPAQSGANPFPPPQSSNVSPFPPPQGGGSGAADPFPPAPGQTGSAQAARSGAPVGSNPFPAPGAGGPPGGASPCEAFVPIRQEVEKNGQAIQQAGERKASREEVCPLFVRFAASEAKMVKFLVTNQSACGIPVQAVKAARTNHEKTLTIRKNVCAKGPVGGPAAGPTLSDAIGGPILPDDTQPKVGRGIFDTLSGSPLSR